MSDELHRRAVTPPGRPSASSWSTSRSARDWSGSPWTGPAVSTSTAWPRPTASVSGALDELDPMPGPLHPRGLEPGRGAPAAHPRAVRPGAGRDGHGADPARRRRGPPAAGPAGRGRRPGIRPGGPRGARGSLRLAYDDGRTGPHGLRVGRQAGARRPGTPRRRAPGHGGGSAAQRSGAAGRRRAHDREGHHAMSKTNFEFLDALGQIARDKGISVETLLDALANALVAAYKRRPGRGRGGRGHDRPRLGRDPRLRPGAGRGRQRRHGSGTTPPTTSVGSPPRRPSRSSSSGSARSSGT